MPSPQHRDEELLATVLEMPPDKRQALLDAMCEGDSALHRRLESLLAARQQAGESPPSDGVAGVAAVKPDRSNAQDEVVGMTIGRYKVLEKLGEGGCGVVYVAEQTEPVRRRVALKVIKLGMDTKQVVARFEAERQALALMDHPNIAKALDAGATENGRPYFVMELVRGTKITEYCDQNNLTTKERLDLFIKVCQAIQHAHQKGIIHRDIKPSNILVMLHDGAPFPKVIDFGIAKATEGKLTDGTVYTELNHFIGTPAYMSPEQVEGSGLDIDTRSDIYSLGVLLYELLAGATPFDGQEMMLAGTDAMRRMIRELDPLRPSTRVATLKKEDLSAVAKRHGAEPSKFSNQLKGDLDWIVMKCLEKDRRRRYETANGLAFDIKRHLNNEPVLARPPTAAYKFQKAFRRNQVAFTAAIAVAATLVAGIGLSTWQTIRATRAEREQNKLREVAVKALAGEKEQRAHAETEQQRADAQAREATESQQQSRRLLYAADINLSQQSLKQNNLGRARRLLDRHRPQPGEEDLRGWEWRYLWQLTRSRALVTLTNRPTRGLDVSFSPDGNRLAVGWLDGRVDLWDVPGRRQVRALTDRKQPHWAHVAFSPVGNLLAATSEPHLVTLYDLDSGRESILWKVPDQENWNVREMSFSPDGSRAVIYAVTNNKSGDAVWVVNVSNAQIERRYSTDGTEGNFPGAARLSPDNRRLYMPRNDRSLSLYSIQCLDHSTGRELWQTEACRDLGLTALALSPDGQVLVSGSGYEDPTIRVWEAATGRLLVRLNGHTGWVSRLLFTKDGRRLISAASDQTIRFWDTSTWTETRVLRGHTDELCSVALSEAAHLVASAGKDGNIMLWQDGGKSATDGYQRFPDNWSTNTVLALDHSRVLLLERGETFDLKSGSAPELLPETASSANVLGWFGTNILCLWNGANRILVQELREKEFILRGAITVDSGLRPMGVAYNPSRQLLAWTEPASSNSVYLANLATPARRIELRSDVGGIVPRSFSEDGNQLLAVTTRGNSRRVWNIEKGQIVASIDGFAQDAIFAAGGRVLVLTMARGNDHEIRFYDLNHAGQEPRRIPGNGWSDSVAASPDGGLVAAATYGGVVRLFDPIKGEWIEDLHGHLNAVFNVAFSPNGRRLISTGGGREAVKLWDVRTRQELLTLAGTGSILGTASWIGGGDMILVGPPWQAWSAPSWEEIAAAEAKDPPSPGLPPSTGYGGQDSGQGKTEVKQP
jgi:serine/threonine protein kinase/WD40 repeat protein